MERKDADRDCGSRQGTRGVLRVVDGASFSAAGRAEGRAYLAAARRILADLDEAEQSIADQGAPRGRIRVSAAVSHGRPCIVPLLGEFVRRYPNIVVDINLSDGLVDGCRSPGRRSGARRSFGR